MDSVIYTNKANQVNTNPFLNKPINNIPNKCVLVYMIGSTDVINLLHDRIQMIARDGLIMGKKGSNIAIIETDLQPATLRDKLMSGEGANAEIFVMSFSYLNYAGWLNSSNTAIVKSFFERQ